MAWSVEYGNPKTLAEQQKPPEDSVDTYLSMGGDKEALQFARDKLFLGYTVWSIKDDAGNIVMNQDEVWRKLAPPSPRP